MQGHGALVMRPPAPAACCCPTAAAAERDLKLVRCRVGGTEVCLGNVHLEHGKFGMQHLHIAWGLLAEQLPDNLFIAGERIR